MDRGLFGVEDEGASSTEIESTTLLVSRKGELTTFDSVENRYIPLQNLIKANENARIDDEKEG